MIDFVISGMLTVIQDTDEQGKPVLKLTVFGGEELVVHSGDKLNLWFVESGLRALAQVSQPQSTTPDDRGQA